jgi:hypothetical protein
MDSSVPLTEYAWEFRYPGEEQAPTRKEAADATVIAGEVYDAITARLPEETKP